MEVLIVFMLETLRWIYPMQELKDIANRDETQNPGAGYSSDFVFQSWCMVISLFQGMGTEGGRLPKIKALAQALNAISTLDECAQVTVFLEEETAGVVVETAGGEWIEIDVSVAMAKSIAVRVNKSTVKIS